MALHLPPPHALFEDFEFEPRELHDLVDVEKPVLEPEEEAQVKQDQIVGRIELPALPFEIGFQERFHGIAVVRVLLTERRLEKLVRLDGDRCARRELQRVVVVDLPRSPCCQEGVDVYLPKRALMSTCPVAELMGIGRPFPICDRPI